LQWAFGGCSQTSGKAQIQSRFDFSLSSKRTEAVLKELFEAIRMGCAIQAACMAAGISYDCFGNWRREDLAFDADVERSAAESA
jgi:hypothetical protein